MNKTKLFIENFFIYGVGSVIGKLIPLIMLPIITRLLPGSEYFGLYDLHNTIVSLMSSLAIMGMYDAMYRLFFDKEDLSYKKNICSTTIVFVLFTSFIFCLLMYIFKKKLSLFFFGNEKYEVLIYFTIISTLVSSTNSIVSAPTRMQNKRTVYLIINTLSSVISYAICVPLLLRGNYLIALPLATIISGSLLNISFFILNKKWFNRQYIHFSYLKLLLPLAIPLLPNFLIYWIYNSCDKIMITNLIGVKEAGIYSVGTKLGQASQLIYVAFASGWQFFSFSTMNDENQVRDNSLIFEYLGVITFISSIIICFISYPFYKLIFSDEYLKGYIVAPYLFISPLLLMLFQVAVNQFIIIKKTWPNMFILAFGAIINLLMNYYLIPKLGIEGAAIATLSGYFISVIICVFVLKKCELMILRKKFLFCSLLFCIYFILWRYFLMQNILMSLVFSLCSICLIILCYKKDLNKLLAKIKKED